MSSTAVYQNTPSAIPAISNSHSISSQPYPNPPYGAPCGNAPYGSAYPSAYGGQARPMYQGAGRYAARAPYAAGYGSPMSVVSTLTGKWRTSATIWTVIGVCQIISGLFTLLLAIGIAPLALGIWNIVQASKLRNAARQFQANPAGILRYADSNSNGVLELIINFIFGAFFGIIGAIFDISSENYAKAHRQELWEAEQMAMGFRM